MNETIRTLVYVSVAVVVGLISWASQPRPQSVGVGGDKAELSDLKAVGDANSFDIVQYDEELAKLDKFSVAKVGGRWVIPSHHNYPADAEEQLKKIASLFIDLKSIAKVTDRSAEHELYGVVEPSDDLKAGAKGVGRLVTISDKKGNALVKLIVGSRAEATDSTSGPSEQELHYVRIAGQDPVHLAEISLSSLSTKFEQWIERDLLKLNAFDVAKMTLKDYSVSSRSDGQYLRLERVPRMQTMVSLKDNAWNLDSMQVYEGKQPVEAELADDEELNKTKLDDVKTALDDLKIIDVDPKPEVLVKALQDDKLASDREAIRELIEYGFVVMRNDEGKPDVYGVNGGMSITEKTGVEYQLYFGVPQSADKTDSTKLNRFLMVTARLNQSVLPPPALEPEPPAPAGPEPTAAKTEGEEKKDETKKDDAEKSEEEIKQEELAKKERERIKRENQRKIDDYQEKVKKANDRVAELNSRFENWFYVVSDDVYKKVVLSRADIVKDSGAAKEGGYGIDAFRELQKLGLKGQPTSPPPSPPNMPFGS